MCVRYGSLVTTLAQAVSKTSVHWFTETTASTPLHDHDGVTLPIHSATGDRTIRARILVNAEGGLYKEADATSALSAEVKNTRDYGQTAIVGTVSVSSPQPDVAWERFTPEGPIALLPMRRRAPGRLRARLVLRRPKKRHAARNSPTTHSSRELGVAFGERMGRFTRITGRATFPLGLNALNALVDRRTVAIGNAAQTLHPVAGQGLNLGLRDAHALCDALSTNGPTPLALSLFAQRRALDRRMTIGATDTLARLFTVDFAPLAAMRGLGAERARIRAAGQNRAGAADDVRAAALSPGDAGGQRVRSRRTLSPSTAFICPSRFIRSMSRSDFHRRFNDLRDDWT